MTDADTYTYTWRGEFENEALNALHAEGFGHPAEGARAAGCEWLHVDLEEHLRPFYAEACGFRPTEAGLIALCGPLGAEDQAGEDASHSFSVRRIRKS